MLPGNIDLTTHRDFTNHSNSFELGPIQIELIDADIMSTEDYESLMKWEYFFGKIKHRNQKWEVFDTEEKFFKQWANTCCRCGNKIRIPWKNHGVCEECKHILDRDSKIPWINPYNITESSDFTIRNLFDAR